MTIDLYLTRMSTQCAAIRMVATALNVDLNLIYVDMAAKEHLKPEFLAINPQHTIPTLHDNGFALWETRAILTYLVEQYGPADSHLYPAGDAKKRATINQRLYFDMGTLYQRLVAAYFSAVATDEAKQKVSDALAFLDGFLSGGDDQFVAGAELTVADFVLFTTVSLIGLVLVPDFSAYPQLGKWYKRLQETLPGREINAEALEGVKAYIAAKKASN